MRYEEVRFKIVRAVGAVSLDLAPHHLATSSRCHEITFVIVMPTGIRGRNKIPRKALVIS